MNTIEKNEAKMDNLPTSILVTSPEINEYAAAMVKVLAEIENPERNRDVTVTGRTKDGRAYSYQFKYATFDKILEHARPLLAKNGIYPLQVPTVTDKYGLAVVTRLIHTSGQWVESTYPITAEKAGLQGEGAAISYIKRYALSAMLAIASDEDDDANVAEGNQVSKKDGEDLWGGPLTKTQLKAVSRELASEIEACDDLASLISLLNVKQNIELTDQMMRDMPSWYYGQEGSDVAGLHQRIEDRRSDLATSDAERAAIQGEPADLGPLGGG